MKKIFIIVLTFFLSVPFFSQNLSNVYLDDDVYSFLEYAQSKGYCSFLIGSKPYTQKQILNAFYECLEHEKELSKTELQILHSYLEKFNQKKTDIRNGFFHAGVDNKNEDNPVSFLYDFSMELKGSGGLYFDRNYDQFGIDVGSSVGFKGDLSKFISYKCKLTAFLTTMPLMETGDYFIGYNWYDTYYQEELEDKSIKTYSVYDYLDGVKDSEGNALPEPERRSIRKFLNNSYLPYDYSKPWDGSVYLISNLSASGLEGWASELGIAPLCFAEINTDFFESKLQLKFGRHRREWASMDEGSSLVLNKNARPFFAGEVLFQPFKFLKYSSLTGALEYPNQEYIVKKYPGEAGMNDAYFWQNLFSINMIEIDFPYFHFDFGSSTVWPKRFDLGYIFPLFNYVLYQNNLGDYDNTALFGDIKVRKPGIGSLWASIFIDEINGLNNDVRTSPRAMFAGQLGGKIVIPGLKLATLSVRYTKVEPYCYTHQMINYTPWYNYYISENYTNNGSSIGYYLDPNSDETFVRFDMKVLPSLSTALQYQFIRHGADYGSQQVPGSSLYSELSPANRNSLTKYFLRDGAYNWMHIIKLEASYTNKNKVIPFALTGSVGFMYSYYTAIDEDIYNKRYEYGNNNNSGADRNTLFHFIDTDEYPVQCGFVLTLGIKLWNF